LSVVRHASANVDDIFPSIFTGDTLGATQIPKTREIEFNQCASQGMWFPPWPPFHHPSTQRLPPDAWISLKGWNPDAIERQLAHSERDGVRAEYNYAEYLPERRKMVQAWSDYLDTLKTGATTATA